MFVLRACYATLNMLAHFHFALTFSKPFNVFTNLYLCLMQFNLLHRLYKLNVNWIQYYATIPLWRQIHRYKKPHSLKMKPLNQNM